MNKHKWWSVGQRVTREVQNVTVHGTIIQLIINATFVGEKEVAYRIRWDNTFPPHYLYLDRGDLHAE